MLSVRDILWHKQGHLKFPLPEGTKINRLISNEDKIEKKESVAQMILRKLKKSYK